MKPWPRIITLQAKEYFVESGNRAERSRNSNRHCQKSDSKRPNFKSLIRRRMRNGRMKENYRWKLSMKNKPKCVCDLESVCEDWPPNGHRRESSSSASNQVSVSESVKLLVLLNEGERKVPFLLLPGGQISYIVWEKSMTSFPFKL